MPPRPEAPRTLPGRRSRRPRDRTTTGPMTTGPSAKAGNSAWVTRLILTPPPTMTTSLVGLDAGQDVDADAAAQVTDVSQHAFGITGRCAADDDDDLGRMRPAERGRTGHQGVVDVAADYGVDHQRLEPGVPGSALLGRTGVDQGRCEGDLAGVAQHGLAQPRLLRGGRQVGHRVLGHLDGDPDQLDGLLEADHAGQLAGRGREHLGGDAGPRARRRQPGGETTQTELDEQADLGAGLRLHRDEPRQRLEHPLLGQRGELAGGSLDPAGCRRDPGGTRLLHEAEDVRSRPWARRHG